MQLAEVHESPYDLNQRALQVINSASLNVCNTLALLHSIMLLSVAGLYWKEYSIMTY